MILAAYRIAERRQASFGYLQSEGRRFIPYYRKAREETLLALLTIHDDIRAHEGRGRQGSPRASPVKGIHALHGVALSAFRPEALQILQGALSIGQGPRPLVPHRPIQWR